MRALGERLRAGDVLVGDGAWGTLLMAGGLAPGEPPEALNLKDPAAIEEIARLYVAAGADLVTTNTFGGSPLRLRAYGLEARCDDINRAAVAAVRRSVGGLRFHRPERTSLAAVRRGRAGRDGGELRPPGARAGRGGGRSLLHRDDD